MYIRIIVTVILMFLFGKPSFSQRLSEEDLPPTVIDAFKSQHPKAHAYEWKMKKKKGYFKAEFIMNGSKYKTYISDNGQWIKTQRELKKELVPQAVWRSFSKSEYVKWKIDDIEELQTPKYPLVYEIEVELKERYYENGKKIKNKQELYLYYLPDGKLVETKPKK